MVTYSRHVDVCVRRHVPDLLEEVGLVQPAQELRGLSELDSRYRLEQAAKYLDSTRLYLEMSPNAQEKAWTDLLDQLNATLKAIRMALNGGYVLN